MSEKGLFIQFILKTETQLGQNLYISGSTNELGNWDKNKSIKLKTEEGKYPIWESEFIKFNEVNSNLEYKYILIPNYKLEKDSIEWETNDNRKLDLSKYKIGSYIVDDGNFSDKSSQKIMSLEEKYNNKDNNLDYKEINNINNNFKEEKKDFNDSNDVKLQDTNKVGLQNIGSTCYMNATLQCFIHIAKFISFFRKINPNNLPQDSLSISFKNLIDHLWKEDLSPNQNENNYYIPTDFRKKIADKNPLFQNDEANDAKDLVNFIIMTLHEELNKANKNNSSNFNIQNFNLIDQTNKDLVFKNFVNDFKKNNVSIISDIFYAMNLSVTQCSICKNKLYNYQIYYFLVFPLEEVRRFKYKNNYINNNFQMFNFNNNFNNNFNIPNEVSIYDCFDYDRKINPMTGQNKMYCNFCKNNNDCIMKTTLVTGPDVLILLLNRGKGLQYNVKINFVEYLNLENYIDIKSTGFNYELFGVITHIGENGQGGHFIAYCRDPFTNVWSKFNDAIVSEVNDFNNDIINFANPYLLFYQKLKT